MNMMLDQKRAKFALSRIRELTDKNQFNKEFVNLAKGSSALVMGNGLMASLAFWKSRGTDPADKLCNLILGWLASERLLNKPDFKEAMNEIVAFSSEKYMLATQETLDFLKWLRQLAAAVIKE